MTDFEGQTVREDGSQADTQLRVTLTVGSRSELLDMMGALKESGITVRTEDIARSALDGSDTVPLDLGKLTDKQRRTLEMALETGYYEQPRKSDLADLADRIGVSKSAVSQRLRTAEAKLVKHAFGEFS